MANQPQTQPDQAQGAMFPPVVSLAQAARLDPTNAVIAQRLARASEGLNDASSAIEEYCRALALASSPADSTALSERLRVLAAYPAAGAPASLAAPTRPISQMPMAAPRDP